jgi:phage repressor protein C with HTH and peptisase S24 domain
VSLTPEEKATQDRLKKLLKAKRIDREAFAKLIGNTLGTVNQMLSGGTRVSEIALLKLNKTYSDINVEWVLTGEGEMLLEQNSTNSVSEPIVPYETISPRGRQIIIVPLAAQAGFTNTFQEEWSEQAPRYVEFPDYLALGRIEGEARLYQVRGSSMEPRVMSGDWVLCRLLNHGREIESGHMYVVITRSGITLKYAELDKKKNGLWLLPANREEHQPWLVAWEEVLSLWEVLVRISGAGGEVGEMEGMRKELEDVRKRLRELEGNSSKNK